MASDRVKLRRAIAGTLRESQFGRLANFSKFTMLEVHDAVKALTPQALDDLADLIALRVLRFGIVRSEMEPLQDLLMVEALRRGSPINRRPAHSTTAKRSD